jgi:hypothetical protein
LKAENKIIRDENIPIAKKYTVMPKDSLVSKEGVEVDPKWLKIHIEQLSSV